VREEHGKTIGGPWKAEDEEDKVNRKSECTWRANQTLRDCVVNEIFI